VHDPETATDPRISVLLFELASPRAAAAREMAERQLVQGVGLLMLAEARGVTSDIDALDALIDDYAEAGPDAANLFLTRFWTSVASATRNQILRRETRFWFELGTRRGAPAPTFWNHDERVAVHREIVLRLRRRTGAAEYLMEVLRKTAVR
jgi:DNA-binding FadR family transcriptional regulator